MQKINYFGVNCSCSIALRINLNHYVKLMLFYSYFYGVNAIRDIDNFFICIIIINRVYVMISGITSTEQRKTRPKQESEAE